MAWDCEEQKRCLEGPYYNLLKSDDEVLNFQVLWTLEGDIGESAKDQQL